MRLSRAGKFFAMSLKSTTTTSMMMSQKPMFRMRSFVRSEKFLRSSYSTPMTAR
jgi:hypothetical protein